VLVLPCIRKHVAVTHGYSSASFSIILPPDRAGSVETSAVNRRGDRDLGVVFVGDLMRPPNQSPPTQPRPDRLVVGSISERFVPAVSSRSDAAETTLQSPPLNPDRENERSSGYARIGLESGGSSEGLRAEKVFQTGVGTTLAARPIRSTEGLPSVFSSEQPAVTAIPKPASDGSLMEIFEKHRNELRAKQPVAMVPSAMPSASAASPPDPGVEASKGPEVRKPTAKTRTTVKSEGPKRSVAATSPLRDPGMKAPKRPEGQGATAKIERKAKTKKTVKAEQAAKSRKPKQSASAGSSLLDSGAVAPKGLEVRRPETKTRTTAKSERSRRSAAAASPPRGPGMKAPKQPEGQGATAKIESKAKTKQTVKAKKTTTSRKPKPKVVRQKKPKPNLSNPAAWSPKNIMARNKRKVSIPHNR